MKDHLNLLIFTLEFPPQHGGIAYYLLGLISHYQCKNKVVLTTNLPQSTKEQTVPNTVIIRKRLLAKWLWPKWIRAVFILLGAVRQCQIDIILTPHILPLGTVALLTRWFTRIPYLISLHGLDILTAKRHFIKRNLAKLILSQARGIVVNSKFTKQELEKLIKRNDIPIVILYPCPTINNTASASTKFLLKKQYNIESAYPIILSVGRLVRRKGFDTVIKALPPLIKKWPHMQYIIVGDGPDRSYLCNLTKNHNIESHVLFVTNAGKRELKNYYALSDIFVMASRRLGADVEGFGLVYIEANLFNLPVIGTHTGGIPDAIINNVNGILIDPDSPKQVQESISKLLMDTDLAKRLGKNGRKRALNEFTWNHEVEKFTDWLKRI